MVDVVAKLPRPINLYIKDPNASVKGASNYSETYIYI